MMNKTVLIRIFVEWVTFNSTLDRPLGCFSTVPAPNTSNLVTMGLSKSEKFDDQQNELADIAKAIGHPARIAILQFLIESKSCVCGDIVEHLPLSQSTVSQHLKALKEAGMIKGDIDGPSVCYCIHPERWQQAQQSLLSFFESFDTKSTSCC